MSLEQSCQLVPGQTYHEDDIPLECKHCLGIEFDAETYWGYPKVASKIAVTEYKDVDCSHGAYYWGVTLEKLTGSERQVEIAASCDDCGSFAYESMKTVCRSEGYRAEQ